MNTNIRLNRMIELVQTHRQRTIPIRCQKKLRSGDIDLVKDHATHDKITVAYPSHGSRSRSAEGYRLDKNTGRSRMTGHEPPMDTADVTGPTPITDDNLSTLGDPEK